MVNEISVQVHAREVLAVVRSQRIGKKKPSFLAVAEPAGDEPTGGIVRSMAAIP